MPLDKANTIVASTDAADVTGCRTLFVDTTAGNLVVGGLSGGVEGQRVDVVKKVAANTLTLEHQESTGTEKFYFDAAADQVTAAVKSGYGFVYDGTDWVCVASPVDGDT